MLRAAWIYLVSCLCVHAQFSGLATPADGSRVYFATTLRQKNTTQPTHGKLFQVDPSGLQLFLSRDEVIPSPPVNPAQAVQTNAYDLFSASVSADGKAIAVAGNRACAYGDCTYARLESYTTTITANGQSTDYPGNLQLSASGGWAFGGSSFGFFNHPAYLFNVTTGTQVDLGIPSLDQTQGVRVASTGRSVADDGTVVWSTGNTIVMIRAGQMQRVVAQGFAADAVLDRLGHTVVFSVCTPGAPEVGTCTDSIRLADASGSGSSLLISDAFAPSLSDDGRTLLYLSNRSKPQIHIFTFDNFFSRQLGSDRDGIASAILSGDGSTVYAVTLGGRLVKIPVATRTSQELIPRTPYLSSITSGSFPSPGKLSVLPGVGLTDLSFTADPPLPESLYGISVTIQGRTALMQNVAPSALTVLVPSDVVPSANGTVTVPIDVTLNSPSPFDGPHQDLYVPQYAPEFLPMPGQNTWAAAHQDWNGIVSADSPARPGEVIHGYAVGLGDTSPSVAFGHAAPSTEPLARLTIPIGCNNVEVLFQGMAPGYAGVYQIDIRLPLVIPNGNFGLYCVWGGIGTGGPGLATTIPVRSAGTDQSRDR
jgi:uncharacterized protein (TIGR03437 family)